jgi:small subunit ribosomal protein S17e
VRPEHIKRVARELLEKFPDKFSSNFEDNKKIVDVLVLSSSERVKNRIAGYVTSLFTIRHSSVASEASEEHEEMLKES